MTHIKTIFSLWTGTDKYFIGNAFCSSDGSVTQLIHDKQSLLQTSRRRNPEESNVKNEGTKEWVFLFLSNDQETPCPERYDNYGTNR